MKKNILLILLTTACSFCAYAQDTTFYNSFQTGNTVFFTQGKAGLMDREKKLVIPAQYSSLSDIRYGLVKASLNYKVGFVDTNNKTIIPFIYDEDTSMCICVGARLYKVLQSNDKGEVSATELSIGVDENYTNFSEGLCAVIKDGKYGFIDTLGNIVIPFQFDAADNFYNQIAIVKVNGKYGAINNKGAFVIPATYYTLVVDSDEAGIYAPKYGEDFWLDYTGKVKPGRRQ